MVNKSPQLLASQRLMVKALKSGNRAGAYAWARCAAKYRKTEPREPETRESDFVDRCGW